MTSLLLGLFFNKTSDFYVDLYLIFYVIMLLETGNWSYLSLMGWFMAWFLHYQAYSGRVSKALLVKGKLSRANSSCQPLHKNLNSARHSGTTCSLSTWEVEGGGLAKFSAQPRLHRRNLSQKNNNNKQPKLSTGSTTKTSLLLVCANFKIGLGSHCRQVILWAALQHGSPLLPTPTLDCSFLSPLFLLLLWNEIMK